MYESEEEMIRRTKREEMKSSVGTRGKLKMMWSACLYQGEKKKPKVRRKKG